MADVTELHRHQNSTTDSNASTSTSSSPGGGGAKKRHRHHHHQHPDGSRHQTMVSSVSASMGVGVHTGDTSNTGSPLTVAAMASHDAASSERSAMVQVPLVRDTMTFEGRQASRLREMERRIESEMKRKKREWQREVERMREEFLELYPADRVWGSEEMLNDPLVARRCGSTDILDAKKMKTLFMDYPDSGRRYKIRFNVADCDPKTVRVSTDGDRIVVRAIRFPKNNGDDNGMTPCGDSTAGREYCRKIQKPKDVDQTKFKAYLTSDSILVVEAPVPPSLNLRKAVQSPSHSHCGSTQSRSPSGSPAAGVGPDTPSKEKIGVPIFRDENGRRRLHLIVDLGNTFQPHDITVQVIKDNKIQVRAKHEEKTIERLCKSKFSKEYELSEKIETLTLSGGLSADGRLYVGAFAKGHNEAMTKTSSSTTTAVDGTQTVTSASVPATSDDENNHMSGSTTSLKPCQVLAAASGSMTTLPSTSTSNPTTT